MGGVQGNQNFYPTQQQYNSFKNMMNAQNQQSHPMGPQAAAAMNMQFHSPGMHNMQPNGGLQRQMIN
jgi:hypothetical protein